ncbi:hypothetical protein LXL04_002497 [Taraxacum kok-saghyz]
MDTNIVRSLMELKCNEKDCGKVYDRKRKRESNVSEIGEGSKKDEVVKKAAKNNSKKKSQPLQKRRYSSMLASVISKKTVQNSPVTRSQAKGVVIEVEDEEEDEEEEDEEEEEVRERRSKNKHDGGSKENVKNKSSSSKKGKDKKEEPKGKHDGGKRVVEEENEEEDEEEEVRERRSKNKHDGGSKENMEKRSRKRLVDEDDEDVVVDEVGPSRKGKRQEAKKPKKEAVRKTKAANDFPSMKNRCSPIALLSIIHGLSKDQKNSIRDMGFGTLLQSKLMDVPMKMCYYVLEKLDVEGMKVVLETGVLDVSVQSVYDRLGLPLGGMSFEEMEAVDEDDKESSCGSANLNALYHIKKETDISSINWCQYVVDCLKRTKRAYKPDKESSFFYGLAAYLALLYVDEVKFDRMDIPRTRLAICQWSFEMIRVREDYEMMEGGFGLGQVNGVFVEDFVDISDDDEDDIEYEEEVQEDVVVDSDDERIPDDVINANPVSFVPFHGTEAVVVPFIDVPVDAVPICVVPSSGTNAGPSEPKKKQKREKKPSMALMSPFKERIVDPRSALTPDENAIWMKFTTTMGVQYRSEVFLKAFFSRTYIHSGVLDAWSDYLNEKEKEQDVMNSPFRLFMKPAICLSLENERVSEEKNYEIFKENFKAGVYGDKDLLLLKGVDLVFFPVIRSEHIYLFVFNLRKPAYEGVDNSADDAEFLDKYGAVFVPLKMFFMRYLFEIGHQKAFDMSQEELTPRRIKLPWRTIYNKYDCGVFTMRHMETYFGESAASKWKPGFSKEGNFQNKLLEKLREKYATTLLLWRMNTRRDEILCHARQYCQTVEPHVRQGDRGKAAVVWMI